MSESRFERTVNLPIPPGRTEDEVVEEAADEMERQMLGALDNALRKRGL